MRGNIKSERICDGSHISFGMRPLDLSNLPSFLFRLGIGEPHPCQQASSHIHSHSSVVVVVVPSSCLLRVLINMDSRSSVVLFLCGNLDVHCMHTWNQILYCTVLYSIIFCLYDNIKIFIK